MRTAGAPTLPRPSIDTGMGLERLTAVLQGVHDNYDIDLFRTLIEAIARPWRAAPASRRPAPRTGSSPTTCARPSFLIADGVAPSNEGRGYVLRRIMRRAMRHAHLLGASEPLMHRLVPALVAEMGEAYPELRRAEPMIAETLRQEEERFQPHPRPRHGAAGRGGRQPGRGRHPARARSPSSSTTPTASPWT